MSGAGKRLRRGKFIPPKWFCKEEIIAIHASGRDYYIPNLKRSEQPEASISKYGRMRRRYLKEHRPVAADTVTIQGGAPYISQSRTYVPIRALAEALGYEVEPPYGAGGVKSVIFFK